MSPTYDVAAILTSIQSLLHDPNPNSPANAEAASLYRENMKEYVRRVKATVEASWLDDGEGWRRLRRRRGGDGGGDSGCMSGTQPLIFTPSTLSPLLSHTHITICIHHSPPPFETSRH